MEENEEGNESGKRARDANLVSELIAQHSSDGEIERRKNILEEHGQAKRKKKRKKKRKDAEHTENSDNARWTDEREEKEDENEEKERRKRTFDSYVASKSVPQSETHTLVEETRTEIRKPKEEHISLEEQWSTKKKKRRKKRQRDAE